MVPQPCTLPPLSICPRASASSLQLPRLQVSSSNSHSLQSVWLLSATLGLSVAFEERPSQLTPPVFHQKSQASSTCTGSLTVLAAITSVSQTEEQTHLLRGLVKAGQCQKGGAGPVWKLEEGRAGGSIRGHGGMDVQMSPERPWLWRIKGQDRKAGPARSTLSLEVRSQQVLG